MNRDVSLFWLRTAALLGGLGVALGAYAAHGLDGTLTDLYAGMTKEVLGTEVPAAQKYLGDFKTAAQYQMYHALALLAVGLLPGSSRAARNVAGWAFLLGTMLFSGSLYLLVLSGITWLGAITPIGGVLLIVGWVTLLFGVRSAARPHPSAESS